MASFAAQLKHMFFGLVERVTGYGCGEDQHAAIGAQVAEASRTEEVVAVKHTQNRARGAKSMPDDVPEVPRGSLPQVNSRIL
ncbi:hypothetical protein EJB05_39841, partial [Eragrostis curvula]